MLSKAAGRVAQVSVFTRPSGAGLTIERSPWPSADPMTWEQHGQGWGRGFQEGEVQGPSWGCLSTLTLGSPETDFGTWADLPNLMPKHQTLC